MRGEYVCDVADRAAWLQARKQYVTASEAAVLMGCNPYTNTLKLYQSKTSDDVDESTNEHIRRGVRLESAIVEACYRDLVQTGDLAECTLQAPVPMYARGVLSATADALATTETPGGPTVLIEAKAPRTIQETPHQYWLWQCWVQMYVYGADMCWLVQGVETGRDDTIVITRTRVDPNPLAIADLLPLAEQFMAAVRSRRLPVHLW